MVPPSATGLEETALSMHINNVEAMLKQNDAESIFKFKCNGFVEFVYLQKYLINQHERL